METSLKTGFAQNFSRCPKNLSCPKIWGGCSPPRPPGPYAYGLHLHTLSIDCSTGVVTVVQLSSSATDFSHSETSHSSTPTGHLMVNFAFKSFWKFIS